MQINYTEAAFTTLLSLVNFIESKNTKDAGLRWLNRYEAFLNTVLKNAELVRLCNNKTFKQFMLRCAYFNDWVIAFSINDNNVLIEALLHKSRIAD